MIYIARIEDGVVVDVGSLAPDQQSPEGWVTSETRIGLGWRYVDGVFERPTQPASPPRVPPEITKVQFVRAMRSAGLWTVHRESIEAHPDWQYITSIPRGDEFVKSFATALNITDEQVDALWISGAAL